MALSLELIDSSFSRWRVHGRVVNLSRDELVA